MKLQANVVASMLANWDDAEAALESAMNAAGSAMAENEKAMQSMEAMIKRLTSAIQQLWRTFTDDDLIKSVVVLFTALINAGTKLIDTFGSLVIVSSTVMAYFAIFKRELFVSMITGFNTLVASALKSIPAFNGLTASITNLGTATKATTATFAPFSSQLNATSASLTATGVAAKTASASVSVFSAVLKALPLMFVVTAISWLINKLYDLHQEAKKARQELEENAEAFDKNKEQIQKLYEEYKKLSNIPKPDLPVEKYERLVEVQNKLAQVLPGVALGFDAEGNAIVMTASRMEQYLETMERTAEVLRKQRQEELRNQMSDLIRNLNTVAYRVESRQDQIERIAAKESELGRRNLLPGDRIIQDQQKRDLQELTTLQGELNDAMLEQVEIMEKINGINLEFITDDDMQRIQQKVGSLADYVKKKMEQDPWLLMKPSKLKRVNDEYIELIMLTRKVIDQVKQDLRNMDEVAGDTLEEKFDTIRNGINEIIASSGIASDQLASIFELIDNEFANYKAQITDVTLTTEKLKNIQLGMIKDIADFTDKNRDLAEAIYQVKQGHKLSATQIIDLVGKYEDLADAIYVENGQLKLKEEALYSLMEVEKKHLQTTIKAREEELKAHAAALEQVAANILKEIGLYKELANAKASVIRMKAIELDEMFNKQQLDVNINGPGSISDLVNRVTEAATMKMTSEQLRAIADVKDQIEKAMAQAEALANSVSAGDPINWLMDDVAESFKDSSKNAREIEEYVLGTYKTLDSIQQHIIDMNTQYRKMALEKIFLPDGTVDEEAIRQFQEYTQKIVDAYRERQRLAHEEKLRIVEENKQIEQQIAAMGSFESLDEEGKEKLNDLRKKLEENEQAARELSVTWWEFENAIKEVTEATDKAIFIVDQYTKSIESLTNKLEDLKLVSQDLSDNTVEYNKNLEEQRATLQQMINLTEKEIVSSEERIAMLKSLLESQDLLEITKEQLIKALDEEESKWKDLISAQRDYKQQLKELEETQIEVRKKWIDDANELADRVIDVMKRAIEKSKDEQIQDIDEIIEKERERHEERLKNIEDELNAFEKAINEQIALIDEQAETEEYYEQLRKAQEERARIQRQIDVLSMDTSIESQTRLADLRKQLAEQDEKIEKLRKDRERKQRKDSLQKELEQKREETDIAREAEEKKFDDFSKIQEEKKKKIEQDAKEMLDNEMYWEEVRINILQGNIEELKTQLNGYWEEFTRLANENTQKAYRDINANLSLANELLRTLQQISEFDYSGKPNIGDDLGDGNKFGYGSPEYGGSYGSKPPANNTEQNNKDNKNKEDEQRMRDLEVYYANKLAWWDEFFKYGTVGNSRQRALEAENDRLRAKYSDFEDLGTKEDLTRKFPEFKEKYLAFKDYIANKVRWETASETERKRLNEKNTEYRRKYGFGDFTIDYIRANRLQYFQTGGYTGDWPGNLGKLAVLHKKELVLNEKDTDNFLSAIKLLRNFVTIQTAHILTRKMQQPVTNVTNNRPIDININIDRFVGTKENSEKLATVIVNKLKGKGAL